ncbi:MAG: hypothetical protein WBP22_03450 [Candidatus Saccharimonas sp.]
MNETPITPASNTPQPQKSANNKLPWIILIIITLVLGGTIAWLALQLQSTTTKLTSSESELASTQSKDGSANNATEPANPDAPVAADTDEDQIINTAIGWGTARESTKSAKLTVNITKKQLPFADVSIGTEEGTGYGCTLKKSNNVWLVLFCGQSVPSQAVLDEWGIPASFAKSDY